MREFVIVAHDAPVTPDFPLNDLPGAAGRLDVLCRCVTAGLLTSHGIRDDSTVTIVIGDELTIRFEGATIRHLQPDERSTAARFRTALERVKDAVGHLDVEASPGIHVSRRGLGTTVADRQDRNGMILLLHEDGDPIVDRDPPDRAVFVLSDHRSFTDDELQAIEDAADGTHRLGPVALHADQAITVAHHYLDTGGYRHF